MCDSSGPRCGPPEFGEYQESAVTSGSRRRAVSSCPIGLIDLPDEEELIVAGGRDVQFALARGAAQRGADVFFGVRKVGKRHLQRGADGELLNVTEQLRDDLLVFAVPPLGDVSLTTRFEAHGARSNLIFIAGDIITPPTLT